MHADGLSRSVMYTPSSGSISASSLSSCATVTRTGSQRPTALCTIRLVRSAYPSSAARLDKFPTPDRLGEAVPDPPKRQADVRFVHIEERRHRVPMRPIRTQPPGFGVACGASVSLTGGFAAAQQRPQPLLRHSTHVRRGFYLYRTATGRPRPPQSETRRRNRSPRCALAARPSNFIGGW